MSTGFDPFALTLGDHASPPLTLTDDDDGDTLFVTVSAFIPQPSPSQVFDNDVFVAGVFQ